MVHKYPLMKPMILLKSTIQIEKNNINVNNFKDKIRVVKDNKWDIYFDNV